MATTITRAITVQADHWHEDARIRAAASALVVALSSAPGVSRRLSLVQVRERITFKVTVREEV